MKAMTTKSSNSPNHDYRYTSIYKLLVRTMMHTRTGAKFKRELLAATADGFPIDYTYSILANGKTFQVETLLNLSLSTKVPIVITQILLDHGADVNIEDYNGMNSLLIASQNFRYHKDSDGKNVAPSYFAKIIEKTDDINKVSREPFKLTALSILCQNYCRNPSDIIITAIKMLLDAGADISAGDDWRYTPWKIKNPTGKFYRADELYNHISLYVQQKEALKSGYEYACFNYEL